MAWLLGEVAVMRVVQGPTSSVVLPDAIRNRLDSVRDLPARFPKAGLRSVSLMRASALDPRADTEGGARIWLALENLQVTGSFKVRGALVALDEVRKARAGTKVVTASAGNHGVGIAYAARALELGSTVIVPRGVPEIKRTRIESMGAEVVTFPSEHYDDAEAEAKALTARTGAVFVSAYEGDDVALGNGASLGFEIVSALEKVPDCVILPFGGGGLASGLGWALAAEAGDGRRRIWGAQSSVSCAMATSLERGEALERCEAGGETLAEGLEGGISAPAFARARDVIAGVVVVGEERIGHAMSHAYRKLGLRIEGSSATALVPVLDGLPAEIPRGDVVIVLTGSNIDDERLTAVLSRGA